VRLPPSTIPRPLSSVFLRIGRLIIVGCREDLREQHAIGEEIAEALTQGAVTNGALDDDELEEELADLQQEELDNKMLRTGSVPVGDQVHRLPTAAVGECEFRSHLHCLRMFVL